MNYFRIGMFLALFAVFAVAIALTYEHPPVDTQQVGYRGTGMDEVYNPRTEEMLVALNQVPAASPPLPSVGPRASEIYKNVKVLGDLSAAQFTRVMTSMVEWVAPQEGCAYCHAAGNFASDKLYTKVVARRMLRMTMHINSDWKRHVANTGVTCWTCHRGQHVPAQKWASGAFIAGDFFSTQLEQTGMDRGRSGQNAPSEAAASASLPFDPFTPFLADHPQDVRVVANTALPGTDLNNIKQTEWTYALMMHMSDSLGVNCTYCHNTRSFTDWSQSSPARVIAYHGIRMVRDVNNHYISSLTSVFPPVRKGPLGDVYKVNCATCHQGLSKPLYGVSMLKDYPELSGAPPTPAKARQPQTARQPQPEPRKRTGAQR